MASGTFLLGADDSTTITDDNTMQPLEGGDIAGAQSSAPAIDSGWRVPGTNVVLPWLAIGATIVFLTIAWSWTHKTSRRTYAR